MGVTCSVCREQPVSAKKDSTSVGSARSPRNQRSTTKISAKEQHDGQRRANLQVKAGGFALKNFAATNDGKLEDFVEIDKKLLGEGGFGSVRKGKHKRTGQEIAVKSIRKNAQEATEKLKEEIEIMRLLDHPNIARFCESFEDKLRIYLCLELCAGGELFDRICQVGRFNEGTAGHLVKQMLLAINYLHQNRITHRDLKPENWLLSTTEDVDVAPLKLIDFGISKRFTPGVPLTTRAGTPNYVAPEVLVGKYDEKADIWSLGVIMYVLLSGTHPFSGTKVEQVLAQVKQAKFSLDGKAWHNVSEFGKALVKAFLQKSTSLRLAAVQGLQHPWFQKHGKDHEDEHLEDLEVQGLKAFGRMNQLKRAVLTVIATQLSHTELDHLSSIFMAMDNNSDGTLSIPELRKGLQEAKVDLPMDLDKLLEQVDTDGSGVVDYTEFLAATMDKKFHHQEDTVWNAFQKFDLDGSGAIDIKELAKILGQDEVVKVMHLEGKTDNLADTFKKVDKNGDGMIDFEEFFAMMCDVDGGDEVSKKKSEKLEERRERIHTDIGIAMGVDDELEDVVHGDRGRNELRSFLSNSRISTARLKSSMIF